MMPVNIQEAYRIPNRLDQKRNSSRHIVIRTTNALNKERILKAVREKGQVTYKRQAYQNYTRRFTRDCERQKILDKCYTDTKRTQMPARVIYPAKLSVTIDGETKVFHNKTKLTHYLSMTQPFKG